MTSKQTPPRRPARRKVRLSLAGAACLALGACGGGKDPASGAATQAAAPRCFAPEQLRGPWTVEKAAADSIHIYAEADAVGIGPAPTPPPGEALPRQQTHIDVSANCTWSEADGYLIAAPAVIVENILTGQFHDLDSPWPEDAPGVALTPYVSDDIAYYVNVDGLIQCKDEVYGEPDLPNPFFSCRIIAQDGSYVADFDAPARARPVLPSLVGRVQARTLQMRPGAPSAEP